MLKSSLIYLAILSALGAIHLINAEEEKAVYHNLTLHSSVNLTCEYKGIRQWKVNDMSFDIRASNLSKYGITMQKDIINEAPDNSFSTMTLMDANENSEGKYECERSNQPTKVFIVRVIRNETVTTTAAPNTTTINPPAPNTTTTASTTSAPKGKATNISCNNMLIFFIATIGFYYVQSKN